LIVWILPPEVTSATNRRTSVYAMSTLAIWTYPVVSNISCADPHVFWF